MCFVHFSLITLSIHSILTRSRKNGWDLDCLWSPHCKHEGTSKVRLAFVLFYQTNWLNRIQCSELAYLNMASMHIVHISIIARSFLRLLWCAPNRNSFTSYKFHMQTSASGGDLLTNNLHHHRINGEDSLMRST